MRYLREADRVAHVRRGGHDLTADRVAAAGEVAHSSPSRTTASAAVREDRLRAGVLGCRADDGRSQLDLGRRVGPRLAELARIP